MAALRSCISGSPYIHDCAAAAPSPRRPGDGPNTLSFAPMRARNGRPRIRSWASGPTKGTVAGRPAISGAKRGLGMEVRMSAQASPRIELAMAAIAVAAASVPRPANPDTAARLEDVLPATDGHSRDWIFMSWRPTESMRSRPAPSRLWLA